MKIRNLECSPFHLYPCGRIMGVKMKFQFQASELSLFKSEFVVGKRHEIECEGETIVGYVRHARHWVNNVALEFNQRAEVTLSVADPNKQPELPIQSKYRMMECIDATGMEDVLTVGYTYPAYNMHNGFVEVIVDGVKIEMFKERFR